MRRALLKAAFLKGSILLSMVAMFAWASAMAQSPTYKLGRAPTEAEIREWDIIFGAKGKELPPGKGTAAEGAPIYAAQCAVCHGKNGEGAFPYRPLVGGMGTINTTTPRLTVGSYTPYATTIWEFINRAMPKYAPRTLTPDNVYALTAWILYKNGIIKSETEVLDKNGLLEIQMPNRNGFFPVPPQSEPDRERSWFPYWNQAPGWKPAAK
jgi:mono/diheme cytochrome c family protein